MGLYLNGIKSVDYVNPTYTTRINGNLAFWDTNQYRIVDAIGPSVVKFIDHFVTASWYAGADIEGWYTVTDHAAATTLVASSPTGVLQVACGDTDNDEHYMQLGSTTNEPFIIGGTAGVANTKPLYFGARVKALEHADEAYFVGMAGANAAAADFMTDASGVLADKDFIGFNTLTGTPDAWNVTWRNAGNAVQAIAAVAVNAADWHTFEFWYDGVTTVRFYIDGTVHATTATTTAATFPGGEELAPMIGLKTGEGVLKRLQIDWLRAIQFN